MKLNVIKCNATSTSCATLGNMELDQETLAPVEINNLQQAIKAIDECDGLSCYNIIDFLSGDISFEELTQDIDDTSRDNLRTSLDNILQDNHRQLLFSPNTKIIQLKYSKVLAELFRKMPLCFEESSASMNLKSLKAHLEWALQEGQQEPSMIKPEEPRCQSSKVMRNKAKKIYIEEDINSPFFLNGDLRRSFITIIIFLKKFFGDHAVRDFINGKPLEKQRRGYNFNDIDVVREHRRRICELKSDSFILKKDIAEYISKIYDFKSSYLLAEKIDALLYKYGCDCVLNISNHDFYYLNFIKTDLSEVDLSNTLLSYQDLIKPLQKNINFSGAIITNNSIIEFLKDHNRMFLSNRPDLSSREKVESMKELFAKKDKEIENKGCIVENKDAISFWLDNNLIFFIDPKEETWHSSNKERRILNSKFQEPKNRQRTINFANQLIKKYSTQANNGDIKAKIVLGYIYESMGYIYKAVDWYIDAFNSRHIRPLIQQKTLVDLGAICEYLRSPFLDKAIYCYTEAANQGYIPAMHALRDLYLKLTPKRDLEQAIYWQEQIINVRINETESHFIDFSVYEVLKLFKAKDILPLNDKIVCQQLEIIIKALDIFRDNDIIMGRVSARNFLTGNSLEACGLRRLVPILKQQCADILEEKKVSYSSVETFLCSDILYYRDIFAKIYDFRPYSEYKVDLLSYYFCGASIDLTSADFTGVNFAGKVLDYKILQQIPDEVKMDGAMIPRQSIFDAVYEGYKHLFNNDVNSAFAVLPSEVKQIQFSQYVNTVFAEIGKRGCKVK